MSLTNKLFVYAYNGSCMTACQGGGAGGTRVVFGQFNLLQVPIDATVILPGR